MGHCEFCNMLLYLYMYKCSCKQCYVVLTTRFYNISFKINNKLYIASGSARPLPQEKFWVCSISGLFYR
jgi:hypothetical protein